MAAYDVTIVRDWQEEMNDWTFDFIQNTYIYSVNSKFKLVRRTLLPTQLLNLVSAFFLFLFNKSDKWLSKIRQTRRKYRSLILYLSYFEFDLLIW